MLAKLGYSATPKSFQNIQLPGSHGPSRSQVTISPIPQGGWAGELSAMKGKLEPTLTGYTESQILGNNIARPNWQLELSHGGRMYTRAVG